MAHAAVADLSEGAMGFAKHIGRDLAEIRAVTPLIHSITNYVVMNSTANALLAVGAAPVMAHAVEEVEEMAGIANGVVLNIGTLSLPWVEAMKKAAVAAKKRNIPLVLDPVGAGATTMRTSIARELIELATPTVVRGNASEILALHDSTAAARGVDSQHTAEMALDAARTLAQKHSCIVSVSGETDMITNGLITVTISNGTPMMQRVTGMGCIASVVTAAFCAVNSDYLGAAASAMAVMGITGELALKKAAGPGTLQLHFIDTLYNLQADQIGSNLKAGVV